MPLRSRLIALAERSGAARPLRQVKRRFAPRARRDWADHQRLELLLSDLPLDANCVDVGAYRGEVLDRIVRYAPGGRHIAFEPVRHLSVQLARRFPAVEVRNCALADYSGTAEFQIARSGWSRFSSVGLLPDATVTEVPVRTLDGELAGQVPYLIKVDVEGAELAVLRGARETLSGGPIVVFEQGHFDPEQTHDIHRLLTGLGFAIFDLRGNGPLDGDAFAAAARDPSRINFRASR